MLHPNLHLGVVAIEKGAFWLPSITVANFTYFSDFFIKSLLDIFLNNTKSILDAVLFVYVSLYHL